MHDTFSPGFLIASPKLDGGPFERTVILMVHHDAEGSMGFIINKPLSIDLGSLLESADEQLPGEVTAGCYELDVHFGGPVRIEQLWLIYNDEDTSSSPGELERLELSGMLQFDENWCLVADSDSIESFVYGHRSAPFRPYIGYTGWGPGQLEEEFEDGSWLFLDFQEDLVFNECDPDDCWDNALARLGVNPMAFLMMGKVGRA